MNILDIQQSQQRIIEAAMQVLINIGSINQEQRKHLTGNLMDCIKHNKLNVKLTQEMKDDNMRDKEIDYKSAYEGVDFDG